MSQPGLEYIKFEDRHLIRDIYIPLTESEGGEGYQLAEAKMDEAYAFTGSPAAKLIFDGKDRQLTQWLLELYAKSDAALEKRENFRLEHDGTLFRAHRALTVAGPEIALRAIPRETPTLEMLHMPDSTRTLLMDPDLLYGGFVLITASTGQGKTTTASATVKSRLEKYKGYAATVEDPPELPLHGWHGEGRCNQVPVTTVPGQMPGSGFAEALVGARRYFPMISQGGTTLMIGEIRNAETAAETLLAANEGHLVIATFHGSSIQNALMRIASMAADKMGVTQAYELLAGTLRLCVFQNLSIKAAGDWWERGEVKTKILSVHKDDTVITNALRKPEFNAVVTAINAQAQQLARLGDKPSLGDLKSALRGVKG